MLHDKFSFTRKTIVDIGSGSGRSTIELARYAEKVIGVEPVESMRVKAHENTSKLGLQNVTYL